VASVNVGDIAEFRLKYVVNGQTCYNVLHYKTVITNLALDNQVVMLDILTLETSLVAGTIVQQFREVMADAVEIESLTGQWVYPIRYRSLTDSVGTQGTVAGTCDAQNLQITVQKSGALANRHNLGAVRVGGVPDSFTENGLCSAAAVDPYDDLLLMLSSTIGNTPGDVTLQPCILNKQNIGTPENPVYVITGGTPVLVWTRKEEIRTQRTRTVGRGI